MRFELFAGIVVALGFLAANTAAADSQGAFYSYRDLTMSADGSTSAWTRLGPKGKITKVAGARVDRVGNAVREVATLDLALSPSGDKLAFLSERDTPHQAQLYTVDRDGRIRRLTSITGDVSHPQ